MGKYLLYPQDGKVRVTSPYGLRSGTKHNGVDLASDNIGIDWNLASADGVVTKVANQVSGAGIYLSIKVDHPVDGKPAWIRYFHLKEFPRFYDRSGQPAVRVGDRVRQGEKIGIEGSTGHSAGAHLHFELLIGAEASANSVDPVPYLWVPKAMPVDGRTLTKQQFANIKYVEDFVEEGDLNMKYGDRGEHVKALQRLLVRFGYSVGSAGTDGIFGAGTKGGVQAFQTAQRLPATGEVDANTLATLMNATLPLMSGEKLNKAKELANAIVGL